MKKQDLRVGTSYIVSHEGSKIQARIVEILRNKHPEGRFIVEVAGNRFRKKPKDFLRNPLSPVDNNYPSSGKAPEDAQEASSPNTLNGTASKKRNLDDVRQIRNKLMSSLPSNIVIRARAGTGKTTTCIQGLAAMMGKDPCLLPPDKEGKIIRITPSEQQRKIWNAFEQSKGAKSVRFISFSRTIVKELQSRVPSGVKASTVHGLGFGQIHKTWDLLPGNDAVNGFKTSVILEEITGTSLKKLRKEKPIFLSAINKIVGLCKANLYEPTYENFRKLICRYDIELDGQEDEIFQMVPKVLEICKDPSNHGFIDFNDMIWLPVIHKLPVWKNDLLVVDECQDLNPCQQALCQMAAKRIIACGDDWQSIYGWAGADTDGMDNLFSALDSTPRQCEELFLTETRRCSHAVVEDARKLVKDYTAHESNMKGESIKGVRLKDYSKFVEKGDMVLCRVNAPLVSECFRLIKSGKKANIQGKNIGEGLVKMIERFDAKEIPELIEKLEIWHELEIKKEQAQKFPSEIKIINLTDKKDCIMCFIQDQKTIPDVIKKIQSLFDDVEEGSLGSEESYDGILLSSGHKSKGLEANNVFFLEPKGATCPHPMAKGKEAIQQEWHLRYVMITRAKNKIYYVS